MSSEQEAENDVPNGTPARSRYLDGHHVYTLCGLRHIVRRGLFLEEEFIPLKHLEDPAVLASIKPGDVFEINYAEPGYTPYYVYGITRVVKVRDSFDEMTVYVDVKRGRFAKIINWRGWQTIRSVLVAAGAVRRLSPV